MGEKSQQNVESYSAGTIVPSNGGVNQAFEETEDSITAENDDIRNDTDNERNDDTKL